MKRNKHKPEQIIIKLREAEKMVAQGKTVSEIVRKLGVSEQTYYRWKRRYGGSDKKEIHRLRKLEKENDLLKKIVADKELDIVMLKAVLSKKW
jgi:putative transposase